MKHPMIREVMRENELDDSMRVFEVEIRPGVRCRVAVSWECDIRGPVLLPDEKPNWRPMTAPNNRFAAEVVAHVCAALMVAPEVMRLGSGERSE